MDHFHRNLYWLLYCTVYFFLFFFLRMQKLFTIFNFQTFSSLPSTVSVKRICSFGDWAKTHSYKLPDWLCAMLLTIARLLCADTQHVMYFTFNTASNSGSILPSTSFSGAHASSSEECRRGLTCMLSILYLKRTHPKKKSVFSCGLIIDEIR